MDDVDVAMVSIWDELGFGPWVCCRWMTEVPLPASRYTTIGSAFFTSVDAELLELTGLDRSSSVGWGRAEKVKPLPTHEQVR